MMDSLPRSTTILESDLQAARSIGWLSERSEAFQSAILKNAVAKVFDAGESIYLHGEPADGLYFIVSGTIQITVPADDGQEFVANQTHRGFWIGDLAGLSGQVRLVTIIATKPTRTLCVPASRLTKLLAKSPNFYRDFYALSYQNMQAGLRILANLAVTRADHRLALRLLHLSEANNDNDDWVVVSQEQLAAMAAVSIPTLQRILHRLADEGVLEQGYGRVRILDRSALLASCQA